MLKIHKLLLLCCVAALSLVASAAFATSKNEVRLTFVETSDVHGNYFPYDFLAGSVPGEGSLARVATYVDSLRAARGDDAVVLLDNGDILQGQPSAYYYNFINVSARHICADVLNFMRYDAVAMGNHDVEAGHEVYDRWTSQCEMPVLGANIVRTDNGEPYLKPYVLLNRKGVRIAILGMVTTGIPQWLPENLWSGLRFESMEETARRYMPELRKKADVVIGLFHSGVGSARHYSAMAENASIEVARRVPGFDIVFCGHDHRNANLVVENTAGGKTLVLNPAANAHAVAKAEIVLEKRGRKHGVALVSAEGAVVDIDRCEPSAAYMEHFRLPCEAVKAFASEVVGSSEASMTTQPAFFGPSAFVDFIHQMQLEISGADISFAAPLAFDAAIPEGPIRVSDLFNLYRFENKLYVMELSGREVKDFLEFSYGGWVQTMTSASDHLLLFRPNAAQLSDPWQRLVTPSYNFDSAAGIRYTVDVTRPAGQRVTILGLADGRAFAEDSVYRCALNSYRGNGGGRHLTEGAGIPSVELPKRIVWSSDKDFRYYMLQLIRRQRVISPKPLDHWKFIPEDWAEAARKVDENWLK